MPSPTADLLALAEELRRDVTVLATDISPQAVEVARRNVERLGLDGRVVVEQGDLFEPLSRVPDPRPFDLIVANPPYIPTSQIELLDKSVKDYEPTNALDGGLDGLTMHRRILHAGQMGQQAGGL